MGKGLKDNNEDNEGNGDALSWWKADIMLIFLDY